MALEMEEKHEEVEDVLVNASSDSFTDADDSDDESDDDEPSTSGQQHDGARLEASHSYQPHYN